MTLIFLMKALKKEGFKFCRNDDQIISYTTDDGHFLAAKVVDNITYVLTHQGFTNYKVKIEAKTSS